MPRFALVAAFFALLPFAPANEALAGKACRSVHLGYPGPAGTAFYNEATVEASADGTYVMACGWAGGYFGIQEVAKGKKLVIFSVWDPHAGDDQQAVPADKRVTLVAKGDAVRTGRFGNEGTGGQSFLDFDWKAGDTYRFLVTAAADPKDKTRTVYTGHFFDPGKKAWAKLAAFSTPDGGKSLSGYYSFVEDFRRDKVSLTKPRRAAFGNGWVRTAKGDWEPLTAARFTADANPATNIDAGAVKDRFFLATGGDTVNTTTKLNARVTRDAGPAKPPADLPTGE